MSESTSDGGGRGARSFQADLSKLVIWAHTHGTMCNQIPALEFMQNMGYLSNDSAVLWMCRAGHAYHWHCAKLHDGGEEETEVEERRKRLLSSESVARESTFKEKRLKLTPSLSEMSQADSGSTESCDRSQGVTEQKADSAYTKNNEPRRSQNTGKPITSFSAAELHFSVSGSRAQTGKQEMKPESDDDIQIISDEKQCEANEDNQGDRIRQDNVSGPSAEVLQMLHCQKMALQQPTASQKAAFAPTARPPLTRAYVLQAPLSDSEDPSRNIVRLDPFTPEGSMAETPRARSLLGSAAPRVCLKPLPVPSTEAGEKIESQSSVMFFEFQATADVQQDLQLSPSECGRAGTGFSRDSADNMGEDREASESGQTPCSSSSQSLESHPLAASNRDVLKKQEKKKSYTSVGIKLFKEWLKLHHPSETRKIYMLPPADLNCYLVSFFRSTKRQNGMEFSANSLTFFQHNIQKYLKYHNYQYDILRGPEFRDYQEAYKLKHSCLLQKKEGEWSVVENLTDEDVGKLFKKGILSKTHPQGLLHIMLTNLIRGFGASTHHPAHQLCWGQVVLRKAKGEVEYLEWMDDLSPGGNVRKLSRRLFAKPEDPESCPVAIYKEYARRRPPDMLSDNHPLYLSPKLLFSMWDKVWYSRKTLAKGKMDKFLKVITQEVRGTVRKSKK